jgi:hypothetical protein
MKCDKCGFVSFDYLSECRRCGANLTATREHLGFSALKSEVPFLLGALLKGGGKREISMGGAGSESRGPGEGRPLPLVPERPFEAGPSSGNQMLSPDLQKEPQRQAKEELIIELSEADLESLSGGKEPDSTRDRMPGKNI